MPIKGLSDERRLSRGGKIHIGEKRTVQRNGRTVTYPAKLDYFKFDPHEQDPREREKIVQQLRDLYGERPQSLKICFPTDDLETIFPHWYMCYSAAGLLCKGDGDTCTRLAADPPRRWENLVCPEPHQCDFAIARGQNGKPGCKPVGMLQFFLPDLPGINVWQIDTGGYNSIVQINSAFDIMRNLFGQIAMIEVNLVVRPRPAHDPATNKPVTIYALDIVVPESVREAHKVQRLGYQEALALPAPDPETVPTMVFPELDPEVTVDADGVIQEEETPVMEATRREPPAAEAPVTGGFDTDPDIAAALDGVPDFKRRALLTSAVDNGWTKPEFLSAIASILGKNAPAQPQEKPKAAPAPQTPTQAPQMAPAAPPQAPPAEVAPPPVEEAPPADEDDDLF